MLPKGYSLQNRLVKKIQAIAPLKACIVLSLLLIITSFSAFILLKCYRKMLNYFQTVLLQSSYFGQKVFEFHRLRGKITNQKGYRWKDKRR